MTPCGGVEETPQVSRCWGRSQAHSRAVSLPHPSGSAQRAAWYNATRAARALRYRCLGGRASAVPHRAPRDAPAQSCEVTTMTDVTSSPAAVITEPQARARRTAADRQARWRKNNSVRRVELHLRPQTVEQLDKLVRETDAFGRAEVVEALIVGAKLPVDNIVTDRPQGAPRVHAGHRHLRGCEIFLSGTRDGHTGDFPRGSGRRSGIFPSRPR
jgi:hypothetical protein